MTSNGLPPTHHLPPPLRRAHSPPHQHQHLPEPGLLLPDLVHAHPLALPPQSRILRHLSHPPTLLPPALIRLPRVRHLLLFCGNRDERARRNGRGEQRRAQEREVEARRGVEHTQRAAGRDAATGHRGAADQRAACALRAEGHDHAAVSIRDREGSAESLYAARGMRAFSSCIDLGFITFQPPLSASVVPIPGNPS